MDDAIPGDAHDVEGLLSFSYMCPVGILQIDRNGNVQMLNPMAAQLLMPLAPIGVISNLFDVLGRYAPDLRNLVSSYTQPRGRIIDGRRLLLDARGDEARILSCTLLKLGHDSIMAMLDDISEQVTVERQMAAASSGMAAIFNGVNDFACFTLDETGCVNSWNPSGVRQTGFAAAEIMGRTLDVFRAAAEQVQGQALDHLDRARREGWHLHEGRCVTRDGAVFWCQTLITALQQNGRQAAGFSVVLRDVTARKVTAAELGRLLTTDHLTGVANRTQFFELASTEIALWQRYKRPLSVVMLDVDDLKRVNETLGYGAGDAVLQALAIRCQSHLRAIDVLARFGGEEFVIMLPGTGSHGAAALAERLRDAMSGEPFVFEGTPIPITVSLGYASIGETIAGLDALLKAADTSLYQAKQRGRNKGAAYPAGDL